MKLIRCTEGHYYDHEKYRECPYCADKGGSYEFGQDLTVSIVDEVAPQGQEDITLVLEEDSGSEYERTIGIFQAQGETERVTGWLVCVEGKKRGASWRLGYGRNSIGRGLDMDVCFSEDLAVSRKNHGFIAYDDRGRKFYAIPGTGLMKLGDMVLEDVREIKEDMILEIGEGKYQFVPFCNGRRTWE